jgi:hypothetical protein
VTLRARWVTLRARWVTLRARWVTLGDVQVMRQMLADAHAEDAAASDLRRLRVASDLPLDC